MLATAPLYTPRHRVAITQDEVSNAVQLLKLEPLVKNDAGAQQVLGPTLDGYPVDYTVWRNMDDYAHFIIDQWNKGKTLTDPIYIEGVDAINPSSVASFSKPILVLINELDFSGGDFFPAIMQDNHRATLFGTRTAGAGGFVNSVKFPNNMGVSGFTMTGSIAVRANHQPIENLGVTPEVPYAPTSADLQGGFQDYGKAVNKAVAKLLGAASAK
jgi:C-terminal processing protease CtpA/Prc